ncbi:MAG: membrane protein insertion efficiency factor YidD [Candidatus Doudnabacteria bacterium]|nr:membrane protein insertion efficiency factor YidD [Candidatus Doudnabacteria bacterium]
MEKILTSTNRIIALPLVLLLLIYQKTISPDHGLLRIFYPYGYCKFYPSCSMYAKKVLQAEGVTGLPKIIKRLMACNPRSLGGVDLP